MDQFEAIRTLFDDSDLSKARIFIGLANTGRTAAAVFGEALRERKLTEQGASGPVVAIGLRPVEIEFVSKYFPEISQEFVNWKTLLPFDQHLSGILGCSLVINRQFKRTPIFLDLTFKEFIDRENVSRLVRFVKNHREINLNIVVTIASSRKKESDPIEEARESLKGIFPSEFFELYAHEHKEFGTPISAIKFA